MSIAGTRPGQSQRALRLVGLVVAGMLLGLCGCSAGKPQDPVAFAQAWLQAVVDYDHGSNCARVEDWMTQHGKDLTAPDCAGVFAEIGPDNGSPGWAGVPKGTNVDKTGNCAIKPVGDPEQTVVRCFGVIYVYVVGPKNNLMSAGLDKN